LEEKALPPKKGGALWKPTFPKLEKMENTKEIPIMGTLTLLFPQKWPWSKGKIVKERFFFEGP